MVKWTFLACWVFTNPDTLLRHDSKDDRDFDNWMRTIFGDGFNPVIDPMFDMNMKLVSGLVIKHQEAMMAEAAKQQEEKK